LAKLNQRARGDDFDFGTGQGRFRAADFRGRSGLARAHCADRRRQYTGHRRNGAVEAEFTNTVKPEIASAGSAPIAVMRPSAIGKIGGRKIDGDAARPAVRGPMRPEPRATRSLASDTALSGRPTMLMSGQGRARPAPGRQPRRGFDTL